MVLGTSRTPPSIINAGENVISQTIQNHQVIQSLASGQLGTATGSLNIQFFSPGMFGLQSYSSVAGWGGAGAELGLGV